MGKVTKGTTVKKQTKAARWEKQVSRDLKVPVRRKLTSIFSAFFRTE